MGAITDFLSGLGAVHWGIATACFVVLFFFVMMDEWQSSETDKFLYTLCDSWVSRFFTKTMMAVSAAIFWPVMLVIFGFGTAVFATLYVGAYIHVAFFYKPKKASSRYFDPWY